MLCAVVGAAALVPLAMDPWGFNPFGPFKVLVLAVCATSAAVGLALDRDLLRTLMDRLRASWVAWSVGALWVVVLLSTLMSVAPVQSIIGSYPEYSGVLTWLAVTVIAFGAASLPWSESWPMVARAVSLSLVIMSGYAILQVSGANPILLNAGAAAHKSPPRSATPRTPASTCCSRRRSRSSGSAGTTRALGAPWPVWRPPSRSS